MPETVNTSQPTDVNNELNTTQAVTPAIPVKPAGKSWAFLIPLAVTICILVLGGILITSLVGKIASGPGGEIVPTVADQPQNGPSTTPAILRTPSAIASQSAFLELDAAINSLNAAITGYVVQDLTLTPPVLDLKLGFTN